ncbi:TPA: hypothetical protein PXR55_004131 [Yersinia enterocolitica]|nr:hypothetical protein [Yersinia enterocolitica]HDL8468964.1 hypothetical protein [Yersinia enterocolitica]HDL8479834.1 hypothetical protein [Yersinia enterocolitica]HDL8508688.1 hypothetical protein [Yersinia enterocolitica]
MMSKFLLIFNYLPFFHISNDQNFGTYNDLDTARYSLFSLPWGKSIFYLFTLYKMDDSYHVDCYKKLSFDQVQSRVKPSEIEEKVAVYKEHITGISDQERERQEEFLKIRITELTGALYSLHNKVSFYSTIGLALLGFLGYLLGEIINSNAPMVMTWILYTLWGVSSLYALNLALFIISSIAISSFYQSSFGDLKKDPNKAALAISFYRDWYDIKDAVRYIASLVKNIEKYLYRLISICIVTWVCVFLYPTSVGMSLKNISMQKLIIILSIQQNLIFSR